MRLKIALIRCGQTAAGEEGRLIGRADEPLTDFSRSRLVERRQAGCYPAATLVYTGEALRCRHAASVIYPHTPAVIVKSLRPFDYGAFEGRSVLELKEDKQFEQWVSSGAVLPCPGGESPYRFAARCTRAFREVVGEMNAKGIEATAIVTHANIMNTILQRYCIPRSRYQDWEADYGGGYFIEYDSSLFTAKLLATI